MKDDLFFFAIFLFSACLIFLVYLNTSALVKDIQVLAWP